MPPRPIYRWKSFWLGIFILAFLGWGWIRATGHVEGVVWMRKGLMVTAGHGYGQVDLSWDPSRVPSPLDMFQPFHELITDKDPRWFPKAVNWEYYKPQVIQTQIAYWLIILVFLLLWSAWLLLHGRRERRKALI